MSFTRSKAFAGLTTALILAGCGTTAIAPMAANHQMGRLNSAKHAFAFYNFFAMDNDLDRGSSAVETLTQAAARSNSVAAVSLYDGSETDDTQLFTGIPGSRRGGVQALREADTGTASALRGFVTEAARTAPGRQRLLTMADHGGGIIRGICSDWNGPGGKKIIHLNEVASAIRETPVDVFFFDACFMNMAEVAYELKDVSKVVIAAQTTTYAGYFPYGQVVNLLDANPDATPQALAPSIVKAMDRAAGYDGIAFGAVDTAKTAAAAQKVAALSQVLTKHLPQYKPQMLAAIGSATSYAAETDPRMTMYNSYRDFGSVMGQLARIPNPEIQQAALAAQEAGKAAVVAASTRSGRGMNLSGATGMALYATVDGSVEEKYLGRSWNRDTGWGDFLVKLNARGGFARPVARDKFPFAFPNRNK